MYCMINHCSAANELKLLSDTSRKVIAKLNDDYWNFLDCKNVKEFTKAYKSNTDADIAFIDISESSAIEAAENFRSENDSADVLLIADLSMSPVDYIRPSIAASSLLLHPITQSNADAVLNDFFKHFFKKASQKNQGAFELNSREEGRTFINYNKILYFEAREKKVFVVTDSREYGFYSTIEELEGTLDDRFKRCHRSFIVNKERIDQIFLSQGTICLDEGAIVPLSRSYRAKFK